MTGFNYPNHPLFRITPLLDKGFQTVNFDPYELVLVAKIRAGQYTPALWDCNSLLLDYGDRLGSPAYPQVFAAKSRYTMTPAEQQAYRDDPARKDEAARALAEKTALAAERKAKREAAEAKLAEQRRIEALERERFAREYAEKEAQRQAAREKQERDWERIGADTLSAAQKWLTERAWILAGSWECARCMKPSQIRVEQGGYAISCRSCGRRAVGDHATLLKVMTTRTFQPQPEIVGSSP